MISFEPKISVKLVKAIPRSEITPGVAAASARYGTNMTDIDLTPYLSENGGVRVSKSVRDPAGGFAITLADKPHDVFLETVYALIEPMDIIEIRMAHRPSDYKNGMPIMMRGLISSVTRSETMSGDRPVRTVNISGQDFGKILQIIQIFYLNNSVVGDNLLTEFAYFHKYANDDQAKIVSANTFVANVLDNVINPYIKRFTAFADGLSVSVSVVSEMKVDSKIDGAISPYSLMSMVNVSLHQMLTTLLDVGAFNELYVEDREDGVFLVVRPAPFKTAAGQFIQSGAYADEVTIPTVDVIALNVSRTDSGVANYFWVGNSEWMMLQNLTAQELAQTGNHANFILFDYQNSAAKYYGMRKMELDTRLGPDSYGFRDSATKESLSADTITLTSWIDKRRADLAAMNKDNVLFEHGSVHVRGNEKIKAGMYINLVRGGENGSLVSQFYVVSVDHEFVPFQGFFTTLTLERGTNFINRAQHKTPDYFNEIDSRGVYA